MAPLEACARCDHALLWLQVRPVCPRRSCPENDVDPGATGSHSPARVVRELVSRLVRADARGGVASGHRAGLGDRGLLPTAAATRPWVAELQAVMSVRFVPPGSAYATGRWLRRDLDAVPGRVSSTHIFSPSICRRWP